jgi:hypothetical protein
MVKRFFAEKGIVLLLGLLISALAISFTYYRKENAKKDLADYWLAKSCPSQENCREKIEATILESQGLSVYVRGFKLRSGSLPSSGSTTYTFLVSSILGEQEVVVSANPPSNGTPFDINNVRIPTGSDSHFIEQNFYEKQPLYVEIWRNQITFLYLDTIVDIPDSSIQLTPIPGSQVMLTNNSSPKTYDIVLPTEIHPIFRQASTERDFISAVVISSLLLVVFSSMFGKEIDKIWQRVFNKKMRK